MDDGGRVSRIEKRFTSFEMVDLNLILGQQWGSEKVVWVRRIENAQQMLEISALLKLLLFFFIVQV